MVHTDDEMKVPDGEQEARREIVPLRILFFRRNRKWYAECLDLDLLTARPTIQEAYREILIEIEMYMRTAVESGEWSKYFPREAPLGHRILYRVLFVSSRLGEWLRNIVNASAYRIPFDTTGHLIGA